MRFDHPWNQPSVFGYNGEMSGNVVWKTKGLLVKGEDHTVIGNLALDNTEDGFHAEGNVGSLLVIQQVRYQNFTMNTNTVVKNNAATQADGGVCLKLCNEESWPLAGHIENNYSGRDLKTLLTDVENKDFRPKSADIFTVDGTGQILGDSTGTLIGPYPPKGHKITQYLIPGQKLDIASHPIPGDESVVVERDALMFRPGFR